MTTGRLLDSLSTVVVSLDREVDEVLTVDREVDEVLTTKQLHTQTFGAILHAQGLGQHEGVGTTHAFAILPKGNLIHKPCLHIKLLETLFCQPPLT